MSEIKLILNKNDVKGRVIAPPSKSFTHRAIMCAALASGISTISNPLICEDSLATIDACRALGARIKFAENSLEIKGVGDIIQKKKISRVLINCRESGSTMRFIIPICGVLCEQAEITGREGLLKRPIFPIVKALRELGLDINSNGKYPPVSIKPGKSRLSFKIKIAGNISSQYISGLLFALPLLPGKTEVIVTTELESKDYILMTIETLKKFGIIIKAYPDLRKFDIDGNQKYKAVKNYKVEGDYSSAAFIFASGALAARNKVIIRGLNYPSLQGDAAIVDVLKKMGASITFKNNEFVVRKSLLKAQEIDAKDIPDLVPILVVLATQARGKTIIKNIERLRIKESNRAAAIVSELKKMGADIAEEHNYLKINGITKLKGATIDTYSDHRIAMACSMAAIVASEETIIEDPVCVRKSYPGFFDDLRKLGVNPMPITSAFGKKIKLSIYGDSHGKKIGALLGGIPKGIKVSRSEIQKEVDKRRSLSSLTTPRREADQIQIKDGIKNGVTTGEMIKIEILNQNINPGSYEKLKNTPRPGHADYTAQTKYASVFDYRGGGFSSGRMTACMVAAGAIAKKILARQGIKINAYTVQIGNVNLKEKINFENIEKNTYSNFVRCPDNKTAQKMAEEINRAKEKKDSVGGTVECRVAGLPIGLGEPLFNSLESVISQAIFSIPAVKGIEFGSGFFGSKTTGSKNNDAFYFNEDGNILTRTNNAGGILGGIANGMPLVFRIAIKPTASIGIEQETVDLVVRKNVKIVVEGRHDPCIAIRVPPIVEAMAAISILDLISY